MWALIIILLLTLALFWPQRIEISMQMDLPRGAEGGVGLILFSGLFALKYKLEFNLLEPKRFLMFYKEGELPKTVWRPGEIRLVKSKVKFSIKSLAKSIDIKQLNIAGSLGIREDAFYTAMLSGALNIFLKQLAIFSGAQKQLDVVRIDVRPEFNHTCLRINLAGIAIFNLIHIISAIIAGYLDSRKRRRSNGTSY